MPEFQFIKSSPGLTPATEEAQEWFGKQKAGAHIAVKVTVTRNVKFHRKFFAMMHVAYDNWDNQEIETPLGMANCPFDKFRKDTQIMAGYGAPIVNTKGDVRYEAKSIGFGKMNEDEFDRLYNDCLNIILLKFLPHWNGPDMERSVNEMLAFAG